MTDGEKTALRAWGIVATAWAVAGGASAVTAMIITGSFHSLWFLFVAGLFMPTLKTGKDADQ